MAHLLGVLLASALSLLAANSCTQKSSPQRLTVLAAASLADGFRDAASSFESANPGVKIEFSFAGSNQLRTQLENGAPGDIFASADRKQMDAAAKIIDPATLRLLAHNRLALILPKDNRAKINDLADLARPGVKIVVADKAVPAGNYTRLMLDKAASVPDLGPAFVTAFDANTVSREENVAAVVTKIALGEADAGLAYASDAAGANATRLTILPLPAQLEQRADYMIAVTAGAHNPQVASRFVEFLTTGPGAGTLAAHGFTTPTTPTTSTPPGSP